MHLCWDISSLAFCAEIIFPQWFVLSYCLPWIICAEFSLGIELTTFQHRPVLRTTMPCGLSWTLAFVYTFAFANCFYLFCAELLLVLNDFCWVKYLSKTEIVNKYLSTNTIILYQCAEISRVLRYRITQQKSNYELISQQICYMNSSAGPSKISQHKWTPQFHLRKKKSLSSISAQVNHRFISQHKWTHIILEKEESRFCFWSDFRFW